MFLLTTLLSKPNTLLFSTLTSKPTSYVQYIYSSGGRLHGRDCSSQMMNTTMAPMEQISQGLEELRRRYNPHHDILRRLDTTPQRTGIEKRNFRNGRSRFRNKGFGGRRNRFRNKDGNGDEDEDEDDSGGRGRSRFDFFDRDKPRSSSAAEPESTAPPEVPPPERPEQTKQPEGPAESSDPPPGVPENLELQPSTNRTTPVRNDAVPTPGPVLPTNLPEFSSAPSPLQETTLPTVAPPQAVESPPVSRYSYLNLYYLLQRGTPIPAFKNYKTN